MAEEKKDDIKTEEVVKEKKKKRKWWILLLLLLLLVGIGVGLFYFLKPDTRTRLDRDQEAIGGMLPGKTAEEVQSILDDKMAEGMVNIGIQAKPVFEYGGKKGRIGIENVETNRYSFQISIVLDDSGESVYESGLLEPGYYLEYVALSKKLDAGYYDATATFTTYSLDESEDPIGTMKVKINIRVEDGEFYKDE